MLLTFAEAKASHELSSVSGVCSDSDTFAALLNQATRKLMNRGDFWGTVQKVRLCVRNHCIVWPRWVGRISALKSCRSSQNPVNYWHDFLGLSYNDVCGRCDSDFRSVQQAGTVPVYRQIECDAKYVRLYCERQADIGKTVVLFGIDYSGLPLRSTWNNGVFQDGIEMVLAIPYVTSAVPLKGISRVVKPVTAGPVRAYQWDSAHDTLLDMATWDPDETSPSYRFTALHDVRSCCDCPTSIEVLVKLEFIPVRNDSDRVLIENLDALQKMILSCKMLEQGNAAGARDLEFEAVRELNLEFRNRFPPEQTAVSNRVFGDAPLSRAIGGMY